MIQKSKTTKLKVENNNRLNKVANEIDVTNESIIFFEKRLEELNSDKKSIEMYKKEKKEIINIMFLAFIILFVVVLIKSSIDLMLGKYLLKEFVKQFLIIQFANVSLCTILSSILIPQIKKRYKCKNIEEINKEIVEINNELNKSQNKLSKLHQIKNDLENLVMKSELNKINILQNNFYIENDIEIYKPKVKK